MPSLSSALAAAVAAAAAGAGGSTCLLATPLPTRHPAPSPALPRLQTALHFGYIPAIILLGMTQTEPRPSWGQLLGPM